MELFPFKMVCLGLIASIVCLLAHNSFLISFLIQALAAIPSMDGEAIQQRLERVRTYYELLNLPFEVSFTSSVLPFIVFRIEDC